MEIREPLRRRPVTGAFVGGLAGSACGAVNALDNGFPASIGSVAAGFVLGGLAVGAVIGSFAPTFRNRWLAGLVVGAAMAVGFLIAVPLWGEHWGVPLTILMAFVCGIIYAGLFWNYRPSDRSVSPVPDVELKPPPSRSNLVE